MKYLTFILLVGLVVALVCVQGAPGRNKKARKCNLLCTRDLISICATNDEDVERTFANDCAMREYNCRHNTEFYIKYGGECE